MISSQNLITKKTKYEEGDCKTGVQLESVIEALTSTLRQQAKIQDRDSLSMWGYLLQEIADNIKWSIKNFTSE